jgi:large subunit ribosomal protein L15
MQMHQLKRKTKRKISKQVGRGGKRGKTSGRGTKGQKARAGRKIRPEIRDLIKRLPKLRGRGKNSNLSIQEKAIVVNTQTLEQNFSAGETVSVETLTSKGIIDVNKGRSVNVKILGDGDLTKKLSFVGVKVSGSARQKIEQAGGSIQ